MGRQRESRIRDGQAWPIGRELEIAWIMDGTDEGGAKVTCAIPAIFDGYWTLELPYSGDHDWTPDEVDRFPSDLIAILATHTSPQPWWLEFLERGPQTELVADDAPRVPLYNGGYVLIEAGAEQAAAWRANNPWPTERQPELMSPHDRSWLATNLWDDDWFYFGGPSSLQQAFLGHRVLVASRGRSTSMTRTRLRLGTPRSEATGPRRHRNASPSPQARAAVHDTPRSAAPSSNTVTASPTGLCQRYCCS